MSLWKKQVTEDWRLLVVAEHVTLDPSPPTVLTSSSTDNSKDIRGVADWAVSMVG